MKRKQQEHYVLLNPTDAARMAHNATHVPFRDWCPFCCESRTKFSAQTSCGEQDGGYSAETPDGLHVHTNSGRAHFFFTTDTLRTTSPKNPKSTLRHRAKLKVSEQKPRLPLNLWRPADARKNDTPSPRALMANSAMYHIRGNAQSFMCARKGGYEDLTKEILRHFEAYGFFNPVIIHCNKEMSIIDVCRKVARERNARTVLRFVPKTSHQSNGLVEAVHGHIRGLARCCQTQIETNTGTQLSAISPAFPFAIRYSGFVLSRFTVRPDGRTPFQYLIRAPYASVACAFGEIGFCF